MGSRAGVETTAARRVGVTVTEYRRRVADGLKWCTACREWHPLADFPVDRSRGDGRRARCLKADHGRPQGPRDLVKERARRRCREAVRLGQLVHPNTLPCTDCGHLWAPGERRHEYDHHQGYDPDHALDVEAVCTLCHADREKTRRG